MYAIRSYYDHLVQRDRQGTAMPLHDHAQGISDQRNVDAFLRMTEDLVKKHSEKTLIRPELGLGKTFDKDKISMWAPELMKSGVFASIDLYGPEIEDGIEEFKFSYNFV